jgi:hypothetical protein
MTHTLQQYSLQLSCAHEQLHLTVLIGASWRQQGAKIGKLSLVVGNRGRIDRRLPFGGVPFRP